MQIKENKLFLLNWIENLILFILVYLPLHTPIMQMLVYRLRFSFYTPLVKDFLILTLICFLLVFNFTQSKEEKGRKYFLNLFNTSNLLLIIFTFLSLISAFFNNSTILTYIINFRYELFSIVLLVQILLFTKLCNQTNNYLINSKFKHIQDKLTKKIFFVYSGYLLVLFFLQFFGYEYLLYILGYAQVNISDVTPLACHFVDSNIPVCSFTGFFSTSYHFAAFLIPYFALTIYYLTRKASFIFANYKTFNLTKINEYIPKLNTVWFANFIWVLLLVNISVNYLLRTNSRYVWFGIINILIATLFFYLLLKKRNILYGLSVNLFNYSVKYIMIICLILPFIISIFYFNQSQSFIQSLNIPNYITKPNTTKGYIEKIQNYNKIISKNPKVLLYGFGPCSSGVCSKEFYTPKENDELNKIANESKSNNFLITNHWFYQIILNNGLLFLLLYLTILLYRPIETLVKYLKLTFDNNSTFKSNESLIFNIYLSISLLTLIYGNLFHNLFESSLVFNFFALLHLFYKDEDN
jgi:hypothetical protein